MRPRKAGGGFTQASFEGGGGVGGFGGDSGSGGFGGRRRGGGASGSTDSGNLEDGGAYHETLGRVRQSMQDKAQQS